MVLVVHTGLGYTPGVLLEDTNNTDLLLMCSRRHLGLAASMPVTRRKGAGKPLFAWNFARALRQRLSTVMLAIYIEASRGGWFMS